MRSIMRKATLAAMLAAGALLGFGTTSAKAQGYGGGYGGGYAVPTNQYYGNGGHDSQPHWHTKQTPFGGYSYYGLGAHDFRPHAHVETPYGITSYSNGRYSSTQSYSPPGYTYRPW